MLIRSVKITLLLLFLVHCEEKLSAEDNRLLYFIVWYVRMKNTRHQIPRSGFAGLIQNWRNDLIAAISVAFVALPLGLGIAAAAGINPMSGVISAICAGLVTTWIRGSHVAINGPGNALIVIVLTSYESLDHNFAYLQAAFITAGILTSIVGLTGFGKFGDLFPSAVIYGMMAAIGLIIVGNQFHTATGNNLLSGKYLAYLRQIPHSIANANPLILFISAGCLLLMFIQSKVRNKFLHFIPGPVWALLFAIPFVYGFNFFSEHKAVFLNHQISVDPSFLVNVPSYVFEQLPIPDFSIMGELKFWSVVLSLTFVAVIETILSAKASQKLDPFQRNVHLNKELVGTGVGTIISGFLGGLPVMTVVARTSINVFHGAKTKWSNFFQGLLLLLASVFLLSFIGNIPKAALSAVLIYTGFKLFAPAVFKDIRRKGSEQLYVAILTMVATILTGLIWGVVIGVLLTFLWHYKISSLSFDSYIKLLRNTEFKMLEEKENQYFIRAKGILNFVNILKVKHLLKSFSPSAVVSLSFSTVPLIDYTVMEYLKAFRNNFNDNGGRLQLMGVGAHQTSSSHPNSLRVLRNDNWHAHTIKRLTSRQRLLKNMCDDYNWEMEPNICWQIVQLPQFLFFELRPIVFSQNVIYGDYSNPGLKWEVSDVTFREGSILANEQYEMTCLLINLQQKLPQFTIEQGHLLDKVVQVFGYENIDYKRFTEKSDRFIIKAHSEEDLSLFFTEELMQMIEDAQVFHIECSGEALIIFGQVRLANPDEIIELITFGDSLVRALINEREKSLDLGG